MDDSSVLQGLKRRDEPALEWVMDRYAPYVSTVIYNIIGNVMSTADIEEVSADVFVTLWQSAAKIKPGKLKAYLGAVARNKAMEKTRSLGLELPLEENILTFPDMYEDIEQRETAGFVKRAVLQMPYPEREIFIRHYYYCQGVAEISVEMGINLSTVKTKLRRGREKLKQVLREGGYDCE